MAKGKDGGERKGKSKPTGKGPRGGKNQIVGTSRTGRPVTKKQYVSRKKKEAVPQKKDDGLVRLNKYIANSGICSRRDADLYIKAGSVTVNGEPVTEMGYKVKPEDDVRFDGSRVDPVAKEYYLLNKPKGFITTPSGQAGTRTVMDLMANAVHASTRPVGRLERPVTGLLLLTNDKQLEKKLTHQNQPVRRIYHVALNRNFEHEDLMKVRHGITLKGKPVKVEDIRPVDGGKGNEVGLEIHQNEEQIVSRIFASLGYEIVKLDRVVYANLTKKDLPRGHFRILTKQEVINLKMM